MATRNIVPRGNGEASLGTSAKHWGSLWVDKINEGADLGNNASLNYRQPSTAYALGAVAYHADLPGGMYLEAIVPGISATTDITISTTTEGTTVTDGTVTWAIRKINVKSLTNLRQPSTVYVAGDIAYSPLLATWQRLEAVTGGTTASTDLPVGASTDTGLYITDGTVKWIIADVRDGNYVGTIFGSLFLPDGYVLANGATVDRADYPRLVALADAKNLWTSSPSANEALFGEGDGSTTMVLPNWVNKMIQLSNAAGASLAAGLPDLNGDMYNGSNTGAGAAYYPQRNGVFTYSPITGVTFYIAAVGPSNTDVASTVRFLASNCNPIYGNSATVQPAANKLLPVLKY